MSTFPKDPPSGDPERTVSLHEGAVSRNVPWLLTPNQAASLENLVVNKLGVRTQRNGARSFGGVHDASKPGGLSGYNNADFDELLVGIWGSFPYVSSGNGGWDQVASSVSLLPGQLHQFVRGRNSGELALAFCQCEAPTDVAAGLTGRSQLSVWNIESDTETQVSLAPRTIAPFQNRLFYGEGETVGWSEIGVLSAFSDANNLLVEPGTGGEITAIVPSRDTEPKLWIFKERAMFLFSPRWGTSGGFIPTSAADALDTINSSIRLLTRGTGCIATRSAEWVPGEEGADMFFLSPDGVRSLTRAENDVQTGAGFPLTYDIPGYMDRINFTAAHRAVAAVFDNAYHLAVPMDGALDNTHVLRYDIANKAWSLHTWQAKDLGSFRLGAADRLWMQNNFATADSSTTGPVTEAGGIYQMYSLYQNDFDPSSDETNVVRVNWQEESRSYVFGDPLTRKVFDRFTFQVSSAETSIIEIAYRRDQGGWQTITETTISGSGGTIVLAEEALPWLSSEEVVRRKTVTFDDQAFPAYGLQVRLGGVTGMSEAGRVSIYFSEVTGRPGPTDRYENDA